MGLGCLFCGATFLEEHHADCPKNATILCPSCSAKDSIIAELQSNLALAENMNAALNRSTLLNRNKQLEEAIEWMEDYLMGTIPEYGEATRNVKAQAELCRRAKGRGDVLL